MRRSCWTEHIPIDSTEACEDVERFLRSTFKTMQKKFCHSVPNDWPSDTDFLKLTAAASGFFAYAEEVMRFIGNPDHADPVSQLEGLLSVIDGSTTVLANDNPFARLDVLYHEILSSIPPILWPPAKRMLGYVIHGKLIHNLVRYITSGFQTLRGMSLLFGISPDTIYACLIDCGSVLRIPDWKIAHKEGLTSLHASFADYLKDPNRSGDFHVGNLEDAVNDVILHILEIWSTCGDGIAPTLVESTWNEYCSKGDDEELSTDITRFHATLFGDIGHCLAPALRRILKRLVESPADVRLGEVPMVKLCRLFNAFDLFKFVHNLMEVSPPGLLRQVQLGGLEFGHLDLKWMYTAYAHYGRTGESFTKSDWIIQQPRSSAELVAYVSELKFFQKRSPEVRVVIFGDVPKGQIATFCRPLDNEAVAEEDFIYYTVPYHK